MQMRAEAISGIVRQSQHGTGFDDLTFANQNLLQMGIDCLVAALVGNAHMNPVVVPSRTTMNSKNLTWSNTKHLAPRWRANIDAVVAWEAELGVVPWISPEVLGDYPILSGPDLKLKIPHLLVQNRLWHFLRLCHLV